MLCSRQQGMGLEEVPLSGIRRGVSVRVASRPLSGIRPVVSVRVASRPLSGIRRVVSVSVASGRGEGGPQKWISIVNDR